MFHKKEKIEGRGRTNVRFYFLCISNAWIPISFRIRMKKNAVQNIEIYNCLIDCFSLFPSRFKVIVSSALENATSLADGFRRQEYNLNLDALKNFQILLAKF